MGWHFSVSYLFRFVLLNQAQLHCLGQLHGMLPLLLRLTILSLALQPQHITTVPDKCKLLSFLNAQLLEVLLILNLAHKYKAVYLETLVSGQSKEIHVVSILQTSVTCHQTGQPICHTWEHKKFMERMQFDLVEVPLTFITTM